MPTQLIYMSQPFGFDAATLAGILSAARRNNGQAGITGALIVRHDLYLQMLEGDAAAIASLFDRIAGDDRHQDVRLLWQGEAKARLFPDWAMLDDPARSWLWSPAQVAAGLVARAPADTVRGVFARVAREVVVD